MKSFIPSLFHSFILIAALMAGAGAAWADNPSGTCGAKLTWEYYPNYSILFIQGTGAMDDFDSSSEVPWKDYRGGIIAVSLMEGITNIGDNAFIDCDHMMDIVNLPTSVSTIGYAAFQNCGTSSIVINSNIKTIRERAFSGCRAITSFDIPAEITTIEDYVFQECSSLKSVTFDANSQLTGIGNYAFERCISLPSIAIPSGVTTIGKSAFEYCTSLESIDIPASVDSIGPDAFYSCTGLTDMTVHWTATPPVPANANAFRYVTLANVNLHVPYGTYDLYAGISPWCNFNILDGATGIEQPTSDSALKGSEKILHEGVLYIQRGEQRYDAQGARVR